MKYNNYKMVDKHGQETFKINSILKFGLRIARVWHELRVVNDGWYW